MYNFMNAVCKLVIELDCITVLVSGMLIIDLYCFNSMGVVTKTTEVLGCL